LSHFEWEAVGLTEMPDFIHWLRDPQPVGTVAIHNRIAKRTESSVNAILSSVAMFYDYHYRLETIPNNSLYAQSFPLYGQYKKFLHAINKAKPLKSRLLKLKVLKLIPKVVTSDQVKQLIDACNHIRDKFLILLLYQTGMRVALC
jgi:integrase/recombinase XerD